MPAVDIILTTLISYGVIKGLFKGLFVEITSLLALLLGVYGAAHFSNYTSEYMSLFFDWPKKTTIIVAFVITFAGIVLLISFTGKAMTKLASFAALGATNKLLGGLFGGLKAATIMSTIILIFNRTNITEAILSEKTIESSILYKPVQRLAPTLLPSFMNEYNRLKLPETKIEKKTVK